VDPGSKFRSVSVFRTRGKPAAVNKRALVEGSALEVSLLCNRCPTDRCRAARHFTQSYSQAYIIQYTRMREAECGRLPLKDRQKIPQKSQYRHAKIHDVTFPKAIALIFTSLKVFFFGNPRYLGIILNSIL